jgi:hypothetical protein
METYEMLVDCEDDLAAFEESASRVRQLKKSVTGQKYLIQKTGKVFRSMGTGS